MTRDEFFEALTNGAKWDVGVSIARTNPLPLDANSVFKTLDDLNTYTTTSPLAYPGQIVAVIDTSEVAAYQITSVGEGGQVQKLAASSAGDIGEALAQLQTQVANIISGTQVVGEATKATQDGSGQVITDTYATKTEVSGIGDRVTAVEGNVSTLQGNFSTLQGTVDGHTSSIAAVEANVGKLQTTVGDSGSGLVKDVNDLKTQIGGVTGAMHFIGTSTTDPAEGTVTIEDQPGYEAKAGDVVLYQAKEYVYDGSKWTELGDEGSYVLKTTTVNGKPLSANVELNASDVKADPAGTAANAVANLTLPQVTVGANQTLATISQANGVVSASPVAIQIEQSQVTGLTDALAGKAAVANVAALETNVGKLQSEVATKVNAAQVTEAIANATIEAAKINGAVANATYAANAGALVNAISINVNGTTVTFNGATAETVNITAEGLGALTSVPVATNEAVGGILIGFEESGTNYAVQLDENNKAFVTVPVPEVPTYTGTDGVLVSGTSISIADNGVTEGKIADGAVTTTKIGAAAVTDEKIASVSTDKLEQGSEELILNGGTSAE